MPDAREIYWNLGHWVVIPMYAGVIACVALVVWGFYRRFRVWRTGRALVRTDDLAGRVWYSVRNALSQRRVLRVSSGGLPHALFFWGLVLLLIGTLLVMLQADLLEPAFGIRFLEGWFYRLFSLFTDLGGLLAIGGLAALAWRRFVIRPKGLVTTADDYVIHTLLFAILLTGFAVESLRIAATELPAGASLAFWSPLGFALAHLFSGMGAASLMRLHEATWWLHLLLVFTLIGCLPFTKLRHLLLTPVDYVFRPHTSRGMLLTLDLQDEATEQFGAARVSDLAWKDIFDADACTSCKRCQDRCPAWATGKPLSPMRVVQQIGEVAFSGSDESLAEAIGTDAIWSCTTCRACEEICPAEIEHVQKIVEMRRNLVLMEGSFPAAEVESAARSVEMSGNPLGVGGASRADWAEGLDVAVLPTDQAIDVLYFAGCYASLDPRNQKVARAFVDVCASAGLRVGILGRGEKCCGEPMRRLGNEYVYQMLAEENVAALSASGASSIVTTCPHCFSTLSRDYRELGLELPVEHHSTFLLRHIDSGELLLDPEPFDCTYHDSCYMGRYMGIFDEPREVLAHAGGTIVEMPKNRLESFCCGGGGGRVLADEGIGTRISASRARQVVATQASSLVSNCPFCLTMFDDALKSLEGDEALQVQDLVEVVAQRLRAPRQFETPVPEQGEVPSAAGVPS